MTTPVGYWTGSLTYTNSLGVTNAVQLGQVDPSTGIMWLIESLTGFDGPDVSGSIQQRANDHGGWAAPQFYAPRIMTLTVWAMAPTQALRDTARSQLAAAVPVNDLATFVYNEPVPKLLQVRRSGQLNETYSDLGAVTFTVGLAAPDPRKYSAAQYTTSIGSLTNTPTGVQWPLTWPITWPAATVTNIATVTNHGDFNSPCTITLTGPNTAPTVTNVTLGKTLSYSALTLAAGDQLVIDTLNRQSWLNGAFRSADLSSQWWRLAPGANTIRLGGSGTGTGTITYRDAYQ